MFDVRKMGQMDYPREFPVEPSGDQCSSLAVMEWQNKEGPEHQGRACWYPQMGGYIAKCVIEPHSNGCFDAWVWHDGEFPFTGDNGELSREEPVRIHHCSARQFIDFGAFAESVCEAISSDARR